jgi:hypothetical protein
MTKEQYLEKKEELKKQAANLKHLKADYKQCQRDGEDRASWSTDKGKHYTQICSAIRKNYEGYRSGHIFMSMVRGRSRVEIENNFEKQTTKPSYNPMEEEIKKLCDNKFEFDVIYDKYRRIISIKPRISLEEKIGA